LSLEVEDPHSASLGKKDEKQKSMQQRKNLMAKLRSYFKDNVENMKK